MMDERTVLIMANGRRDVVEAQLVHKGNVTYATASDISQGLFEKGMRKQYPSSQIMGFDPGHQYVGVVITHDTCPYCGEPLIDDCDITDNSKRGRAHLACVPQILDDGSIYHN